MPYYGPQFSMQQPFQIQPTTPIYQPQTFGYQGGVKQVNGPQSALQYPVAPNTQSEPLFDSKQRIFYIVSADAAGSKTLESFDFSPHVDQASNQNDMYVSRSEFDKAIAGLREEINGIHGPVQPAAATTVNGNAAGPKAQ